MDAQGFSRVVERQVQRVYGTLWKSTETTSRGSKDVLKAFKMSAELQGVLPREAVAGSLAEDIVILFDMIASSTEYTMESWDQRITNIMNRLFLLQDIMAEALIDEVTQGKAQEPIILPQVDGRVSGLFAGPQGTEKPYLENQSVPTSMTSEQEPS
jgi:hypothetical protein